MGPGPATKNILDGFNAKKMTESLPNKIKCSVCSRFRNKETFSQRQLNNLAYKVHTGGQTAARAGIKCRNCTGNQVTELKCIMCDEFKALSGFSRAQRRNPDLARCLVCMESMQLIEPGTEPPAEFGESDPESDDEGLTNPYDSDLGYETGSSSYAADLTADTLTISRGFGGVRAAGANASRENVKPAGPNTMLLVEAFSNMDSDSVMDSQSISATISQTNIESQDGGIALDPGPPEAVEAESPEREKTISTGFSYTDRAMVHSGRAATVKDRGKWVKIKRSGGGVPGMYGNRIYPKPQKKAEKGEPGGVVAGAVEEDDDDDDDYMKSW